MWIKFILLEISLSTLSVFSTNIMLEFRIFAVIKKGSLNDIVIAKVAMTLENGKQILNLNRKILWI